MEIEKSNKFAWVWKIKPDCLEAYKKLHQSPWPELLAEHRAAGIRNYSIFQYGSTFFYCFECDDPQKAFAYLDKSEVCRRWNSVTSKMVEESFDFGKPNPVVPLQEVFYLK